MENLRHISAFNEAFANMLLQFGKGETGSPQLPPPPKFMEAVEHLLLINISHFSKAFMSVKYINSAAMRQLLWAVYCLNSSSSTSSSMFPNILHHALLATISNDPASSASAMYTSTSSEDDFDGVAEVGEGGGGVGDDMLQTPDDNSQKPYLEFVVLWEVLFKIPSKDDATDQQHSFCEFIFDTTMSSLINIIHCLNLDTTTIEDKEQQQQQDSTTISTAATIPSDFISSVSAQNPHDILLLHHLVDFYTFFLSLSSSTSNRWKRFTKWILPCGEAFSRLSAKHPQ